jgi:ATP-binding cassette subfamily G (WHITE) protein 2
VKLLRRLGDEGKVVILSIHQPRYSIFQEFDTVTLLGKGETVYHGRASEAKKYFESIGCVCLEHQNPPDVFLDFIQNRTVFSSDVSQPEGSTVVMLCFMFRLRCSTSMQSLALLIFADPSLAEMFRDSKYAEILESELTKSGVNAASAKRTQDFSCSAYPSTFATQVFTLTLRVARNLIRLESAIRGQIVLSIFLSVLVGTVYYQLNDDPTSAIQDRTGALFLILMTLIFTNMPSVEIFVAQRALFRHESANGYYRVSAYFISRLLGEVVPLRVIPVLTMSWITYWMIGLTNSTSKYLFYILNLLNTSLVTSSLALLSSSLAGSLTPATMLFTSILMVMMVSLNFQHTIGRLTN